MRICAALALAFFASLPALGEDAKAEGKRLLEEGKKQKGKEAVETFTAAIAKDPSLHEAWLGRGVARRIDEPLEALADFAHAESVWPTGEFASGPTFWRAVVLLDALLDRAGAFEELERLRRRGQGAWAYLGSGMQRMLMGRTSEAQDDFDKAAKLDPNVPLLHRWKSNCSFEDGDVFGVSSAEEAMRRAPEDLSVMATKQQAQGKDQPDAAAAALATIASEHPKFAWAHIARAKVFQKHAKWTESLAALADAEKAAAGSAEAAYLRGIAHQKLDQPAEADKAFTQAFNFDPQFGPALKARADLRFAQRDWPGAQRDYEAWGARFALDMAEQGVAKNQIEASKKNGERDRVVLTSVEGLCRRALQYLDEGDFTRAEKDAEAARAIDAKDARPGLIWMRIWAKRKNFDKVFEAAQAVCDLEGNGYSVLLRDAPYEELRKDPQFLSKLEKLTLKSLQDFYQRAEDRYNAAMKVRGDMAKARPLFEASIADYDVIVTRWPQRDDLLQNCLYNVACCWSLIEEKSKALDALEKAIDKGYKDLDHMGKDTDLDNIRNEAKYAELVKKIEEKNK